MITPAAIVSSPTSGWVGSSVTQRYPVTNVVLNKNYINRNVNKFSGITSTARPVINSKNVFSTTAKPPQNKFQINLSKTLPTNKQQQLNSLKRPNKTLSRTDAYYYLAPEIRPVKEEETINEISSANVANSPPSWMPYVNKKFFTSLLPTTLKYKDHLLSHSPTTIKYVYKKSKGDRKKKKKKRKRKKYEPQHEHHHEESDEESWFHEWNPFSCEKHNEYHSKELEEYADDENMSEEEGDYDDEGEGSEYR